MEGLQIGVITELNVLAEKINDNPEHIQNEKNRVYQFNIDEIGPVQLLSKMDKSKWSKVHHIIQK